MMSSKPSVLESKELVQKLAEFGLSTNQAKVYLSICLLNTATVHDISEESKLYAQDIYKILRVLEKKGLIEKIIGPTITYEALPVERALINIIEAQKTQAGERFTRLAANLETVKKHILEFKKTEQIRNEDPKFVLLTTDAEIKNKFDVSYEKTKEEFCVVTTPTLATRIIKIIRARIKTLARRGVETRLIIENPSNNFEKENNLIKRLIPQDDGHFVAKRLSDGGSLLPYRIFDNNEVWIMITKETETGQPSFLWTNAPNIVQFYKRSFDLAWNSPNAVTFRVSRSRSKASASKPRVKVKQE